MFKGPNFGGGPQTHVGTQKKIIFRKLDNYTLLFQVFMRMLSWQVNQQIEPHKKRMSLFIFL